jgi:Arabinose efflux permease
MEKTNFFSYQGNKRWIPVIASVFIQLCLGSTYIWSVFQAGIAAALFKGNSSLAALTFSFMIATLSVGGIIAGILYKKGLTPRYIVIAGGIVIGIGFILASLVKASAPWLLWLTFGLMGGIGMGMAYSVTISACQKWFPDKRGLVTGIIISSLGMGGVIFTPVAEALMKKLFNGNPGSGELLTFLIFGCLFLVILSVGGIFIVEPPKDFAPAGWTPKVNPAINKVSFSTKEMLSTYQYYFITASFLLATLGGLMMIGFAKPIAIMRGISAGTAAIGVIIVSLFNALGRLAWGWVSDRLGRRLTLVILLCVNIVLSLLVRVAVGYWIFVLIAMIGFVYGGFLSNYAALTADYFGPKNMTFNYGLVMIGFGIAGAVASFIAGYFRDASGGDVAKMFPAFIIAAGAAAAGVVLVALLKPPVKGEK